MGNKINTIFNSYFGNSNENQHNNTYQTNSSQNNTNKEKLIPYSYIPNSSDEEEEDINNGNNISIRNKNNLKCIRIIKGHRKWCNCLIILKSNNLCSCSGDKSINIYSNDSNFEVILTLTSCHNDFILYMLEILNSIIVSSASDGTIKFWKIFINSKNQKENNYY